MALSKRDALDEELIVRGYPRAIGTINDRVYDLCLDSYTLEFGAPLTPLSVADMIIALDGVDPIFTLKQLVV